VQLDCYCRMWATHFSEAEQRTSAWVPATSAGMTRLR
jgi:hypothetical protein